MTLVDLDVSHKTVVAVCRQCPWRRVALIAERSKVLALAAAHAAGDHPAAHAAGELRRRAERFDVAGVFTYGPGDLTS